MWLERSCCRSLTQRIESHDLSLANRNKYHRILMFYMRLDYFRVKNLLSFSENGAEIGGFDNYNVIVVQFTGDCQNGLIDIPPSSRTFQGFFLKCPIYEKTSHNHLTLTKEYNRSLSQILPN